MFSWIFFFLFFICTDNYLEITNKNKEDYCATKLTSGSVELLSVIRTVVSNDSLKNEKEKKTDAKI